MTEDDKQKPGLYPAPPDQVPPFKEAIATYQNEAKQALIKTVKGSNDFEWDTWKAVVEYGKCNKFDTVLDFFVNLPSLQHALTDDTVTKTWYWNRFESVTFATQFYYRPELMRMLREKAGTDALIKEGWLVKYVAGRIDTETTWSDASYLIATDSYFAYIQLYTETIH